MLDAAQRLDDLAAVRGNRLEALAGDRIERLAAGNPRDVAPGARASRSCESMSVRDTACTSRDAAGP
jgi:hypothetical protein